MKILSTSIIAILLAGMGFLFVKEWRAESQNLASVEVGNQYQSTTTPALADHTNLCPARVGMASSTTGVLGSVNVLKAGGGELVIYDATTTNANLRSSDQATTSIRLADFNSGQTAGSYHFDVEFRRGLLVDYANTGTGVSSTTISYRCEG